MEFAEHSMTAGIMDDMALYGPGAIAIEDDPLTEERAFAPLAGALITHLADMWGASPMERHLEDIAWGLVNVFHRKIERLTRELQDAEAACKSLLKSQDGSEVRSVELERATAQARALAAHIDAFEAMLAAMADEFAAVTGSAWRPKSGSRARAPGLTSAMLDAREFIAARRAREQDAKAPKGPIVAFSGGADWTDIEAVFRVLDKVLGRHPDMILAHTAQDRGADLIASRWAEARKVDQIFCRPEFGKYQKAAPFRRNDDMLALRPVGCVIFPGNGITMNLGQKAEKSGIATVFCRDATRLASAMPTP